MKTQIYTQASDTNGGPCGENLTCEQGGRRGELGRGTVRPEPHCPALPLLSSSAWAAAPALCPPPSTKAITVGFCPQNITGTFLEQIYLPFGIPSF